MKKIVINLNPQKKNVSNLTLQKIIIYTPWLGLTAIIGLIIGLLLQVIALKKAHTYIKYNQRWKTWESKAQSLQEIKHRITELQDKKNSLEKIVTPRYEMAFILEDIFSSLPKNIWLKDFNFYKDSLEIKGYVVKWYQDYLVSLDAFINLLGQKDYFSSKFNSLRIKKSQKKDFNGVEVLQFVIECKK